MQSQRFQMLLPMAIDWIGLLHWMLVGMLPANLLLHSIAASACSLLHAIPTVNLMQSQVFHMRLPMVVNVTGLQWMLVGMLPANLLLHSIAALACSLLHMVPALNLMQSQRFQMLLPMAIDWIGLLHWMLVGMLPANLLLHSIAALACSLLRMVPIVNVMQSQVFHMRLPMVVNVIGLQWLLVGMLPANLLLGV